MHGDRETCHISDAGLSWGSLVHVGLHCQIAQEAARNTAHEEMHHNPHQLMNFVCQLLLTSLSLIITLIIIIARTMFIVLSSWHAHCQKSLSSHDEYSMASSSRQPLDQAHLNRPPVNWYSFKSPTEGRRLSWPQWLLHTDTSVFTLGNLWCRNSYWPDCC